MKHMIAVVEKSKENKELLAIKNVDKTIMVEVAKISNAINLDNKHSWAISNANIDATKDLSLIGIKKY